MVKRAACAPEAGPTAIASGAVGVLEHLPALRRYAGLLLRNRQEIEDLVHDCLVQALSQLHTRRETAKTRAWLFTILRNLFITRRRQQNSLGRLITTQSVINQTSSVLTYREDCTHVHDVLGALNKLPDEQRTILLLVAVDDLSYAEVAETLNLPIGTVMSRLSRGRERLRQIMDDNDELSR
jgi:RNA polymerase sigma factor (sigma-70 family)